MKIILTTTDKIDHARRLSKILINNKLSSCVQIINDIESIYEWEGVVKNSIEYLLLIKTISKHEDKIKKLIIKNHHYNTPEIISINTNSLNEKYTNWMLSLISK